MSKQQEASEISPKKRFKFPKSWQTYLIEFISLSLAVFLGFLAENFREEIAEKREADELAQNFYDELLGDSTVVARVIAGRHRIDSALLELKDYVRDSSLENISRGYIKNFYSGVHFGARFQPTDIVLEQLKNSGSLRYFKSKELQQLTRDLGRTIAFVNQRNNIELDFGQNYIIPYNIEHGDQEFYLKIAGHYDGSLSGLIKLVEMDTFNIDYKINNIATFKRIDVVNMIIVYRNLVINGLFACRRYQELNEKLLIQLRKEYPLIGNG